MVSASWIALPIALPRGALPRDAPPRDVPPSPCVSRELRLFPLEDDSQRVSPSLRVRDRSCLEAAAAAAEAAAVAGTLHAMTPTLHLDGA